ncbi:MAG: nucleoside hydrolase [Clostridia bacterium]|nr:nucleoside hydrolase [Clostridia bacterium]
MTESQRVEKLEPPHGKVSIIVDTDAACEVDDQFAIAYAVRAAEAGELVLEGLHASLSSGEDTAEKLERNYQEILTVLDHLHSPEYKAKTFRGCPQKLTEAPAAMSDAVKNLIEVANDEAREGPLYVVAIGGGTNIATAMMLAPEIKEKIVLVWLAGNSLHWNSTMEWNLHMDTAASEYIFNSGVPMVLMPAWNVIVEMRTTIFELEHYLKDKNDICDYLLKIVHDFHDKHKIEGVVWSKTIGDIAGIAYVLHPGSFETRLVTTPVFGYYWGSNPQRPLMRICDSVKRDPVFMDLFSKISKN